MKWTVKDGKACKVTIPPVGSIGQTKKGVIYYRAKDHMGDITFIVLHDPENEAEEGERYSLYHITARDYLKTTGWKLLEGCGPDGAIELRPKR